MEYLSDDECREIAIRLGATASTHEDYAQTRRDIELGDVGPAVIGPGPLPEDSSCGQFAVQFHIPTSTLTALKAIADVRGVDVSELCRQVIGVFVAQQDGDLGALLVAESEAQAYRPELQRGYE
jgi:hypothetical protein